MKYTMLALLVGSLLNLTSQNAAAGQDYLIKMAPGAAKSFAAMSLFSGKAKQVEMLGNDWVRLEPKGNLEVEALKKSPMVLDVQPNYKIRLLENYQTKNKQLIAKLMETTEPVAVPADNPEIPGAPAPTQGNDPLFVKQWGMNDIGVKDAWGSAPKNSGIVVAVIDTGVDYTHEDLLPNMWRNAGEEGKDAQGRDKSKNGVDDDNNGYVDDVVGWDFVSNDNKPFDLAVEPMQLLLGGGNPGHGTHCAGNVAASTNNGKGVSGVAPNVKIMALRFISDKGEGTTADAIKSIHYAVDNGAQITSNSWGSEGEDPNAGEENRALRDAIQYAQDHNSLFIAAAGNGHQGAGYNNDTDPKPAYPASYDHDIIISVAAIDVNNNLGAFSNWGVRSVDIGAPGVQVFSTTVGGLYADTVIDYLGFKATWDGTSMATPHVAGAAALYWSAHPEKTWQQVKAAILGSAEPIPSLSGKVSSNGKLNVKTLMK